MDAENVGRMIRDAAAYVPEGKCINTGGNLGMVFLAVAIERHAGAISRLAESIERGVGQIARAMENATEANPGGNDGDLSKPGPGTGGVPT